MIFVKPLAVKCVQINIYNAGGADLKSPRTVLFGGLGGLTVGNQR